MLKYFYFGLVLILGFGIVACNQDPRTSEDKDGKTPVKKPPILIEDKVSPKIVGIYPEDASKGVLVNTLIYATLSEEIDPESVKMDSVVIEGGGTQIAGKITLDNYNLGFTTKNHLKFETEYKVVVSQNIKDLAGNPLQEDYSWSFTTQKQPDAISPQVIGVVPADGSSDVSLGEQIEITFNEEMDASSFKINQENESCIGTVQLSKDDFVHCVIWEGPATTLDNKTLIFKPDSDLQSITTYRIKVTTDATDLAGNPTAEEFITKNGFTTQDLTPPKIVSKSPRQGSVEVVQSAGIHLGFGEAIDPTTIIVNASDDSCTGNLQLSADSFSTCLGFSEPKITNAGRSVFIMPSTSFQQNQVYQIRYLGGIADLKGNISDETADWYFTTGNQAHLLGDDPLYEFQWYLENTGQVAFAETSGVAGEDLRLGQVFEWGYTGRNVLVGIMDSGLEITHQDLMDNVVQGGSYDFLEMDQDPTNPDDEGDHGTSVAGLVAARGWNEIGTRGVAPFASIKGTNFLAMSTEDNHLIALGGSSEDPTTDDLEVINLSFGTVADDDYAIDPLVEQQMRYGVTKLREEKGIIYVKSAGNGYMDFGEAWCEPAQAVGTSCQNSNMDPQNAVPWAIVVGALNAKGTRASYSTSGSSLWISAPGGESGFFDSERWKSEYFEFEWPDYYFEPGVLTLDQSGCKQGYSKTSPSFVAYNPFEDNQNGLNEGCDYTSTFSGTSAATPLVSGVVALMLEANPSLTWRDVKHILAETAAKVDATNDGITMDGYQIEWGWTLNQAGYSYHNWYGFGAVDVEKAVSMAKGYDLDLGSFEETDWFDSTVDLKIPDNDLRGISDNLAILVDLEIEAVQVMIHTTHTYSGDVGIELVSPGGTKSILLNSNNGFSNSSDKGLEDMVLLSNAFYGENAKGTWTLRVVDANTLDTGSFNYWKIKFYGHK